MVSIISPEVMLTNTLQNGSESLNTCVKHDWKPESSSEMWIGELIKADHLTEPNKASEFLMHNRISWNLDICDGFLIRMEQKGVCVPSLLPLEPPIYAFAVLHFAISWTINVVIFTCQLVRIKKCWNAAKFGFSLYWWNRSEDPYKFRFLSVGNLNF